MMRPPLLNRLEDVVMFKAAHSHIRLFTKAGSALKAPWVHLLLIIGLGLVAPMGTAVAASVKHQCNFTHVADNEQGLRVH